MNSTTLTPSMDRLPSSFRSAQRPDANSQVQVKAEEVREMVENCLKNGITSTACTLCDRLLRLPDANLSDSVLFARCYQLAGEPRRCLASLEHNGMLAAQVITDISTVLSPSESPVAPDSIHPTFFDYLNGIHLAAQCLFSLEQYDDCINLLEPIVFIDSNSIHADDMDIAATRARDVYTRADKHVDYGKGNVNVVASIYSIVGKCYDNLENRSRCLCAFVISVQIDAACTESAEYIVENCLMTKTEKRHLFENTLDLRGREWLELYYKFQLLDEFTGETEADLLGTARSGDISGQFSPELNPQNADLAVPTDTRLSSIVLVKHAERLFDEQKPAESYRLARQAYIMDPFDTKGLLIYIASMVQLGLKTELFYLGHELSNGYPKMATSWYAVGCYYWSCKKLEQAQKYLQKAIKIDKRFSNAWLVLGHVLAAQEESEHAISAFRSASRLLPGDHRPLMFMAKQLVRTNYLSLALHLFDGALKISPNDPIVLNEVGVVFLKQDRLEKAIEHLALASSIVQDQDERAHFDKSGGSAMQLGGTTRVNGDEIYSNYATALRRAERFEEALDWYRLCLSMNSTDAGTHANIGFTLHLMGRYSEAINEYHIALAHQPTFSFCSDMLSKALNDYSQAGEEMREISGGAQLMFLDQLEEL